MSKIPVEQVVEKYVALRETKRDLERDHEEALKPINEKLEKLETWLLGRMSEDGVDSYKTGKGTAYKTVRTSCSKADEAIFKSFVFSDPNNPMWNLVDFRPLKKGVEEYIEDHKQVPPGLNVTQTTTVNIRSK